MLELALLDVFSPCKVILKAFQNNGLKYYLQIDANMADANMKDQTSSFPWKVNFSFL